MSKLIQSVTEALKPLQSGQTILVGGFGLIGAPLTLIDELTKTDVNNLTVISNNLGESGKGLGIVLNQNKIKKAIGSYFTSNRDVGEKYLRGQLEVELLPQGTLSESIRAGGAGLGGYYTPTAVGTKLAEGKEERIIDGKHYIFEKALRGDIAFIRAIRQIRSGIWPITRQPEISIQSWPRPPAMSSPRWMKSSRQAS